MLITLPNCRTDVDEFLTRSGYYHKGARWSHYPLLAFVDGADAVEVLIFNSVTELSRSTLPDTTPCMQQWGGQWRSDFFKFTLGDARAAMAS